MLFPIPDGRAEQCAQDIASDTRNLIREVLAVLPAKQRGELSEQELTDLTLKENQIRGLLDTEFLDVESGKRFRVGDIITPRQKQKAEQRASLLRKAYSKVISALRLKR